MEEVVGSIPTRSTKSRNNFINWVEHSLAVNLCHDLFHIPAIPVLVAGDSVAVLLLLCGRGCAAPHLPVGRPAVGNLPPRFQPETCLPVVCVWSTSSETG